MGCMDTGRKLPSPKIHMARCGPLSLSLRYSCRVVQADLKQELSLWSLGGLFGPPEREAHFHICWDMRELANKGGRGQQKVVVLWELRKSGKLKNCTVIPVEWEIRPLWRRYVRDSSSSAQIWIYCPQPYRQSPSRKSQLSINVD